MKYLTILLLTTFCLWWFFRKKTPEAFNRISPEEAVNLAGGQKVAFLDVRTSKEVAQGKISGALHQDVMSPSFSQGIDKLDRDATYVVYCRSGQRSARACKLMAKQGFRNLSNLEGGYLRFKG